MRKIEIRSPVWKDMSVGINERLVDEDMLVEITYTKTDGSRMFPKPFRCSKTLALSGPRQVVRSGVTLCKVKIADMEEVLDDSN